MSNQDTDSPLWDSIPWHHSPTNLMDNISPCKIEENSVEKLDHLWPLEKTDENELLPVCEIDEWDSAGPKPSA